MFQLLKIVYDIKIIRFIFIGGLNTVYGITLYFSLIFFGAGYTMSLILLHTTAPLINYFTYKHFLYRDKKGNIYLYYLMSLSLFFINYILINLLLSINFNEYFSGLISILSTSFITFYIQKKVIYK